MLIQLKKTSKVYVTGDQLVMALAPLDLEIPRGQFVAITGASGSGKSTLMHILGCLDTPSTGSYVLNNKDVSHMPAPDLATVRNRDIGFIFQKFHLLNTMTAEQNVALPLQYRGIDTNRAREVARIHLETVGLADRRTHYPTQLSGGQQQRVAIARALACDPPLILADEPTGNLDSVTGLMIMRLLQKLHFEEKKTIILVTHDPKLADIADRVITMQDGKIISDES